MSCAVGDFFQGNVVYCACSYVNTCCELSQEQGLLDQHQQLEVEKNLLSHTLADKTAELQLQTSKTEVRIKNIPKQQSACSVLVHQSTIN